MTVPFHVALFVGSAAVLTALAIFAILWREFWLGLFALAVRAAVRFGLYDPAASEQTVQKGKRDSGFLLFSKGLRFACRLTPGDPNQHPHTIVIPVVCLGIPAFLLAFAVLWAIPLYLLGHVMALSSSSWAILAGFLGIFVYVGAVATALKLLARTPSVVKRVWRRPQRR